MNKIAGKLIGTAVLGGLLLLTGCGSGVKAKWQSNGHDTKAPNAATATITGPADGATEVPTSAEIAFTATKADKTEVTVTDAKGAAVKGAMRADGSSWVPTTQLKFNTQYTATVVATGPDGKPVTRTSKFTTMKNEPGNTVQVNTILQDDAVYGVGMPLMFSFSSDVPKEKRADVERRLMVNSDPPQVGSWYWWTSDEVHYRPKEYWQPNTKLFVRVGVGGLPMGGGRYGGEDVTIRASIGPKTIMSVDDATHTMTVTQNDKVVRTIPVSMGKPTHRSSSGNMVIMTKQYSELFVSTEPGDSYRTTVYYAQRMTWGGQYIHAAPWSEGDQGYRNVSHGCTNVSNANARYLFDLTKVGDPVIVKGTGAELQWGDGWTDWDKSWEEYLKGSALPHPPAASPSASTSPSASPSAQG